MFDVSSIIETLCKDVPQLGAFEPTDVQLSDLVVPTTKSGDEPPRSVNISATDQPPTSSFDPEFPLDHTVVAIDSTSVVLGYVPDGLVGAIRASVITKPEGSTHHHMDRYGAYLAVITNYTKDELYTGVRELVYGKPTSARAPDLRKTLDRLRNLLERHLQLQAVRAYTDALVLLDGSLMAGAVADPMFVIKRLVQDASTHRNSIAALSKSTTLTLSENQLGILSLVDGAAGACYIGDLREH
ncbi:MAG: DNA double-strand break repair nuclease NurA, partial [Halobacteriota archaeon]